MATIDVKRTDGGNGYEFKVTVHEGQSETHHRVSLKHVDYERLSSEGTTPEALVRESFHFLLEREPKESILNSFDLTVIGRYFPEYEREITQRL